MTRADPLSASRVLLILERDAFFRPAHHAMSHPTRRMFLKSAAAGAAVLGLPKAIRAATSANEHVRFGLIGCGVRGNAFFERATMVCDPDQSRLDAAAKSAGVAPNDAVTDLRRVLDRNDIDAVVIATPDHWHAPAAMLACQAGKHVYVEKPCSHNFRESQLLRRRCSQAQRRRSARHAAAQPRVHRERDPAAPRRRHRRRAHRPKPGTSSIAKTSATPSPAPCRPASTTTCGSAPPRWCRSSRTVSTAIGTGGTTSAPATSATTGPTRSTTPAGASASTRCRQRSPRSAANTFSTTTSSSPTRPPASGNGPAAMASSPPRQLVFEMRLWSKNYPYNCDSRRRVLRHRGPHDAQQARQAAGRRRRQQDDSQRDKRTTNSAGATSTISPPPSATAAGPNAEIEEGHRTVGLIHLANAVAPRRPLARLRSKQRKNRRRRRGERTCSRGPTAKAATGPNRKESSGHVAQADSAASLAVLVVVLTFGKTSRADGSSTGRPPTARRQRWHHCRRQALRHVFLQRPEDHASLFRPRPRPRRHANHSQPSARRWPGHDGPPGVPPRHLAGLRRLERQRLLAAQIPRHASSSSTARTPMERAQDLWSAIGIWTRADPYAVVCEETLPLSSIVPRPEGTTFALGLDVHRRPRVLPSATRKKWASASASPRRCALKRATVRCRPAPAR